MGRSKLLKKELYKGPKVSLGLANTAAAVFLKQKLSDPHLIRPWKEAALKVSTVNHFTHLLRTIKI